VTATLHALGCGRAAGAYYTEDPNREARPKFRDNYYTREGNGRGGRVAPALSGAGRLLKKRHFEIFAEGSIREQEKGWYAALASAIALGGTSRFQHQRALEFSGPPALPNNGLSWRIFSRTPSTRYSNC